MRNALIIAASGVIALAGGASAHCQVPCGIYDDPVRITLMKEHTRTIEKSMKEIVRLGEAEKKNYNQIVRWVTNKDEHAQKLSTIATYYFMAQRVAPENADDKDYAAKIAVLHRVVYYAMKCAQTTDLENVEKVRDAIGEFETLYFGKDKADEGPAPTADRHAHGHDGHAHPHEQAP